MENKLENMTKQELIDQLLLLKKSNQKKDKVILSKDKIILNKDKDIVKRDKDIVKRDKDIIKRDKDILNKEDNIERLNIIVANLQRMLFGSKKERFINENKDQLALSFEEFASKEALVDETPVKEKITYERKKSSKHTGRNKLPENLPVTEEVIEPEGLTEEMVKMGKKLLRCWNIHQLSFSSAASFDLNT